MGAIWGSFWIEIWLKMESEKRSSKRIPSRGLLWNISDPNWFLAHLKIALSKSRPTAKPKKQRKKIQNRFDLGYKMEHCGVQNGD